MNAAQSTAPGALPDPQPAETDSLLELGKLSHNRRQVIDGVIEQLADDLPRAYQAALGSGLTIQKVILSSLQGLNISNSRWAELDLETRNVLDLCGAKYPRGVSPENRASIISETAKEIARGLNLPLDDQRQAAIEASLGQLIGRFESAGAELATSYRHTRMQGIIPLNHYRTWLINSGQLFMDFGHYETELKLTEAAINAHSKVLQEALTAAGEIRVHSGFQRHETFKNLSSVRVALDSLNGHFILYFNSDSGPHQTTLHNIGIRVPAEESEIRRARAAIEDRPDLSQGGQIVTGRERVRTLIEADPAFSDALKVSGIKQVLIQSGIDFSKAPAEILIHPGERERVLFVYPLKAAPDGAFIGRDLVVSFDERYGDNFIYVDASDSINELKGLQERTRRIDPDYVPAIMPPISALEYLETGRRLTSPAK